MRLSAAMLFVLGAALVAAAAGSAESESSGNTDGVLTWQLGDLAAGQAAREVVLFAYEKTAPEAVRLLEKARAHFARDGTTSLAAR